LVGLSALKCCYWNLGLLFCVSWKIKFYIFF
jgi:hypothetical protein